METKKETQQLDDRSMVRIAADLDHYTRSWAAFRAHSDTVLVQDRWIGNEFSSQVVDKLAARFGGCSELRVLGVGSGSGELDLKMALAIGSRLKTRIHNTIVDPAAAQLDLCRQNMAKMKEQKTTTRGGLDDIDFDYRQQTIEEYLDDDINRGAKFHFISSIMSMCHMVNYGDVIETLYRQLEDGGVLLIQLDSAEFGSWWLPSDTFPEIRDTPNIYSHHLRKVLDERSIPYEVSRMNSRADITRCVPCDPRQLREEDSLMLDTITMTKNFASSASPDLYRGVVELLKSGKCTEKGEDGKIIFRDFRDSLVIQNS